MGDFVKTFFYELMHSLLLVRYIFGRVPITCFIKRVQKWQQPHIPQGVWICLVLRLKNSLNNTVLVIFNVVDSSVA